MTSFSSESFPSSEFSSPSHSSGDNETEEKISEAFQSSLSGVCQAVSSAILNKHSAQAVLRGRYTREIQHPRAHT